MVSCAAGPCPDDKKIMSTTEVDLSEIPAVSLRRVWQLTLKAWPFMRPLVKHLLILGGFILFMTLVLAGVALVGTDLFNNKILVGDKLQPLQAVVLFVDDSYVGSDIEDNVNLKDTLTAEQRGVVRDRFMIWIVMLCLLFIPMGAALIYYNIWIWQMINQNLRVAMMTKAEHLSLNFHAQSRVGDAIFRIYKDSSTITSLVQEAIIGPVTGIYFILVGLAFVAFFDPRVAVAVIFIFIPMIFLTAWLTPLIRYRALENRVANSDLTSRLQETMKALRVVKANQGERRILDRFHADSQRALDAALFLRLMIVVLNVVVATSATVLLLVTEYLVVGWVLEERETFMGAAVVTIIGYAIWNMGAFQDFRGRLTSSTYTAGSLITRWALLQDLFIGLERAFYLLDLKADIVDPEYPLGFPTPIKSVEWRDAYYAYQQEQPVLAGVNLRAEVGSITAIIGSSGAGKSTLMSLLLRLYDPDDGQISINNTDLRDLRIEDIRSNTAIALQKNVLFAGTVADNIGYATKNASRKEIEEAARIACADQFIAELESGYDTELGERGGKLSTGQRQRVSLARAIVRNTPILILDEPTASLDAETELAVMRNLGEWGADKIVFLITHRLPTIRNADQIVFLEHGKVIEAGSHENLVENDGRYSKFLAASQVSALSLVSHDYE